MSTSSQDSSAAGPGKDLCDLIARRQVVAVVVSGVSAAVTQHAPTASRQGLLSAGIAHCEQFVPGLPKRWGQRQRDVRLEEVFRRAGRGNKRSVLILGEPGAGKTTGARQLCWRVAFGQDAPDQLGLPPGTLPVFIRLRNLRPDDLGNGLQALIVRETELETAGSSRRRVRDTPKQPQRR